MAIWRREEIIFNALPEDKRISIEAASSAFAAEASAKAYATMPITTGKRYYDVLDRYGVKSIAELERKRPGALRGEIIIPNIEEGRAFVEQLTPEITLPIVNPGEFEPKERWSQEEYMVLWLRLLTSSVKEVYLADGWEFSNGGAIEFARALLIRFRFVEGREDRMPIRDHKRQLLDVTEGACKLSAAIKDLSRRGYATDVLLNELGLIAGMIAMLDDFYTTQQEWAYHTDCIPYDRQRIIRAAESVGAKIAFIRH